MLVGSRSWASRGEYISCPRSTPASALTVAPVSTVILSFGARKVAINFICCGATILLTLRSTKLIVTPFGSGLTVSMVTCLFRRVYSELMKGKATFCFYFFGDGGEFAASGRGRGCGPRVAFLDVV